MNLPVPNVVRGLLLFVLAFTIFYWLQFSFESFAGTDAYYHTKVAAHMAQNWLMPVDFPWLPKTVLDSASYVDHHFLFHAFLAPFVHFDMRVGGKVAAVVLAAGVALTLQLALPRTTYRARILVMLLFFAASPAFLYRMSMIRAQSISLVLLLLLFTALSRRSYRLVGALSFLYVWTYNAFPLVVILVACVVMAEWLVDRTIAWQPVVAAGAGLTAGLLINPYFPENITFLYHHIVDKFTPRGYSVPVGNEWYPHAASRFIEHAGIPLLLLCGSLLLMPYRALSHDRKRAWLSLLLISMIFLAMLLKSRRFIELFPPFALLTWSWVALPTPTTKESTIPRIHPVAQTIATALICILCFMSVHATTSQLARSAPYQRFAAAAAWLRLNTERHSLIFTADWDDFPRLFHFNDHNNYLVGLDPYFLYARDRSGYLLWRQITKGKFKGPPAATIRRRFKADYVFVDAKHRRLRAELNKDPEASLVFRDSSSYVFQLTPLR